MLYRISIHSRRYDYRGLGYDVWVANYELAEELFWDLFHQLAPTETISMLKTYPRGRGPGFSHMDSYFWMLHHGELT